MNVNKTNKIDFKKLKKTWLKMEIKFVGKIADFVKVGMGKLSPPDNDPGEPRKPPGME